MERNKEILELLNKLDESIQKGTALTQQIFSISSVFFEDSKQKSKEIYDFLSKSTLNPAIAAKHIVKTDPFIKKTMSAMVETLQSIPKYLTNIVQAIERSAAIQSALMASLQGEGRGMPSLKTLSTQKESVVISKLESANKMAKSASQDKEKEGEPASTVNVGNLSPAELAGISEAFKGLGMFITQFVQSIQAFAKLSKRTKPEDVAKSIVKFVQYFGHLRKDDMRKFIEYSGKLESVFSKIITVLDKVVQKADSFASAVRSMQLLQGVLKRMSLTLMVSNLAIPFIPGAFVLLHSLSAMTLSISWIGLPIIYGRIIKGVESLKKLSFAFLAFSGSFWIMGRIMKKYDVPVILGIYGKIMKLLETVSIKKLEVKQTKKNIDLLEHFAEGLMRSLSDFSNIGTILKEWKQAQIETDLNTMTKVLNKTMELFNIMSRQKIDARQIRKSGPIFVSSVLDLIKSLEKINEKKLTSAEKKLAILDKFFVKIIDEFKKVTVHDKEIKKGSESIKKMKESIQGLLGITLTLSIIAPLAPIAIIGLLFMAFAIKIFSAISSRGTHLIKTALGLMILAPAIILLAGALFITSMLFSKINLAQLAVGVLIMWATIEIVQRADLVRSAKGALAISLIALGLIVFSAGLFIMSAVIKTVNPLTILFGLLALAAFSLVMYIIGEPKTYPNILMGALATAAIGLSLIFFGAGMYVLSKSIENVNFLNILWGAISLGVFGAIMFGIGTQWELVLLGAAATAAIGVALIVYGFGLDLFNKAAKDINIAQAGYGLLILGVLSGVAIGLGALIMSGIGAAALFGGIAAIAAIGLALVAFSWGVNALVKIPPVSGDQIKTLLELIAGLSGVFALAGLLAVLVIPGALAVTAMGLSIPTFILGVLLLKDMPKLEFKQIVLFGLLLSGLSIAYGIAGGLSPLIIAGSIAIWAMSSSLPSFIKTVKMFAELPPLNWGDLGKFAVFMGVLGGGFSTIGALSLFILPGTFAVQHMAKSLVSIASALKESLKVDWKSFPIVDIAKTLAGLSEAFAVVGADGGTGIGGFITGILNAVGIGPNNVRRGIKSVLESGEALMSITKGLLDFQQKIGPLNITTIGKGGILDTLINVVTAIHRAFSVIGNEKSPGAQNILQSLGLLNIKTATQIGIESVMEVGKVFTGIADGLKAWADLSNKGFDEKKISENLTRVLTMIQTEFSKIGKESGGGWFSKGDTQKGIDAVKGVGGVFEEIAKALKTYGELEKMGFKKDSFNPKIEGSIANNMFKIIMMTGDVFAKIGEQVDAKLDDKGQIIQLDSKVKRGIDAVKGVGEIMSGIGNSVQAFAKIDKYQLPQISNNIKAILTVIGEVFADIGSGGMDGVMKSEKVKRGIEAVQGVGKELESIAKSIAPYADLQKGDKKINIERLKNNIKDLLTWNISIIGAIGTLQMTAADPKVAMNMLGLQPGMEQFFKKDTISTGQDVLVEANKGMKMFDDVVNVAKKMMEPQSGDKTNYEQIKNRLKGLIGFNLSIVGAIGYLQGSFSQSAKDVLGVSDTNFLLFNNITQGISVLSELRKGAEEIIGLVDVFDRIKIDDSKWSMKKRLFKDLIGLTKDMSIFVDTIIKNAVTKKELDSTDIIVKFFERFAGIDKAFENFVKNHKIFVKDFKDYVSSINSVELDKLYGFKNLNDSVINIVKNDTNNTAKNLDSVKQYVQDTVKAVFQLQQQNPAMGGFGGYGAQQNYYNTQAAPIQQAAPVQQQSNNLEIYMKEMNETLKDVTSGAKTLYTRSGKSSIGKRG